MDTTDTQSEFVYIGRRMNGDRLCFDYLQLHNGGETADRRSFTRALGTWSQRPDVIGGLYLAPTRQDPDEAVTVTGEASWCGEWPDATDAQLLEWSARDAAAVGARDAARQVKAAGQVDALADALQPLRKAYRTTNAAGRRALLSRVMQVLLS